MTKSQKPPSQGARFTAATLGRPAPPRGTRDTQSDLELALDKLPVGGTLHHEIDGHLFTFIATNQEALEADRRCYCVVCSTCEKLVREVTTSPIVHAREHVQEVSAA
jgi:hypothetical protein